MIGEATGVTLGFLAILAGGALMIWWRIEARINAGHKANKDAIANEAAKREALSADLIDHKLHVERFFVSVQTLEKTEARLITAIEKLSARLETMISRMEQWDVSLRKRDQ